MDSGGILLFGGTFDPIHHGHLIIARAAAEQLQTPKVILIPSAQPPHKVNQAISAAEDRLEMSRLAVQ
ncbi:MAG: adenylyltransferase/cytidyltransferase family protein, partial [Planctomycetes bacterium]|nr:adenylyltransferase/cytidyltransferase family protein [Planctomycetota bacterium]